MKLDCIIAEYSCEEEKKEIQAEEAVVPAVISQSKIRSSGSES